jgi:hypothetical protein
VSRLLTCSDDATDGKFLDVKIPDVSDTSVVAHLRTTDRPFERARVPTYLHVVAGLDAVVATGSTLTEGQFTGHERRNDSGAAGGGDRECD